jgi:predicted nucleotidyltransferase
MAIARQQFDAFIDDLKSTHGANLASVILYGSAAAGDFVANASDYNLLVALHEIRPRDLRAAQAPMREWQRLGHPVPVYFTVSELKHAADVFPIEFHQMEKARLVLYGKDVLADLNISDEFLRHQTEYELRSKLIQLRRMYIPASVSVESLIDLMRESLASFASLFRAVLLLHGVASAVTKQEIVAATVKHLNINPEPFDSIFALRENASAKTLDEVSANKLFSAYMREIEKVIDSVDKIRKS